jgi:hypothetical protein
MRQVFTFAIPSPALPVSGSVGMISACNYPGFHRKGTPLRKNIGSKCMCFGVRNKTFLKKSVCSLFLKKTIFFGKFVIYLTFASEILTFKMTLWHSISAI